MESQFNTNISSKESSGDELNNFRIKSDSASTFRSHKEISAPINKTQLTNTDDSNEYETDDFDSESTEQMQLNPNTEFYDQYKEYEDTFYVNRDEDDIEPLPEAKELVQSTSEEEDMGYDEDDERIAIVVERPEEIPRDQDNGKEFMNEEGSGSFKQTALHRYKNNLNDNRFRIDYLGKYRKINEKLGENKNKVEEPREGSGNFANDDDDDNKGDDENDDDEDDDGFFNSKRNLNSRYFRKNTNDAIKIISTPLGKVGIVYQQTASQDEHTKQEIDIKKTTSFTDFDSLSPDPESSHRLASSHPKITPVLTPDGKVALLYRGDSENSKYEPIRNLTNKFNNENIALDNNVENIKKEASIDIKNNDGGDDEIVSLEENADTDKTVDIIDNSNLRSKDKDLNLVPNVGSMSPTSGSFIIRPTDSVLPMINRPLSEVLGIKKNQFKQFRVKDASTTSSTEATALSLSSSPNAHVDRSAVLHLLTKVNLADYPTSARTRNFDFDFSHDNTMLDERTRHNDQNQPIQAHSDEINENTLNTIANEVLSKTEVVNLAVVPHFEEDLERLQRLREYENKRHYRQGGRQKQTEEELSGIHCIMQAMMGIAAISTVFGMLGTFFKQRILDQMRLMHW